MSKKTESVTLKAAIDCFIKHLEVIKRSPETTSTYRDNLNRFYKYLIHKNNCQLYVDTVTAYDFEMYLQEKCSEHSSAYRFNLITAFKGLFGFCYMKGYCKTNISKQVKQIKRRVKERVYLTDVEFDKLIKAIDHLLINAVVQTMYYSGLRINECVKLTLDDVDFDKNSITVRQDKEKQTRVIPINYKLRAVLIEYMENWNCKKDTDRFFATRTGSISPNYVNSILHKASKEAGLNKEVSCHIMRHSFASNLISKGADLHKIQKLLGHTSLKTTSIYLHTNMNELRKAVNVMN